MTKAPSRFTCFWSRDLHGRAYIVIDESRAGLPVPGCLLYRVVLPIYIVVGAIRVLLLACWLYLLDWCLLCWEGQLVFCLHNSTVSTSTWFHTAVYIELMLSAVQWNTDYSVRFSVRFIFLLLHTIYTVLLVCMCSYVWLSRIGCWVVKTKLR